MKHPGTITFVEEHSEDEQVRSASEVPEQIAFVSVGEHRVPVVRIVSHMRGEQRVIRSYAADGRLLETTVQAPPSTR
ncbi:MAG: hypothetical protein ACI9U2_000667 [Bradymonadia bacterium]|jgi:hypothetical protein